MTLFFQALWGIFLAGVVGYAYHRSWRWEHGGEMPEPIFEGKKPRSKETVVWTVPTVLPIALLIILVVMWATDGERGLWEFRDMTMDVMMLLSAYFVLLTLVLPLLRRFFSARACATMWILPCFLLWPNAQILKNMPLPKVTFYIPSHVLELLTILWFAGFVAVFGWKVATHFLFRRRILRAAVPVTDEVALAVWAAEQQRAEYFRPVKLLRSAAVQAPFSMGNTKRGRVTVLPERTFTEEELHFIFRHEICHMQRSDVDTKIFLAFCTAFCWYNPLVWMAIRRSSSDLELSCDEQVLTGLGPQERKRYAQLLLNTAGPSTGFTTCLSAAGSTMRYRLRRVVTAGKRWRGTVLLMVSMFLCVMLFGNVAFTVDRGTVSQLILEPETGDWEIQNIYYRPAEEKHYFKSTVPDPESLLDCLGQIQVEKLGRARGLPSGKGPRLILWVSVPGGPSSILELSDEILRQDYLRDEEEVDYVVRGQVDWQRIESCLEIGDIAW